VHGAKTTYSQDLWEEIDERFEATEAFFKKCKRQQYDVPSLQRLLRQPPPSQLVGQTLYTFWCQDTRTFGFPPRGGSYIRVTRVPLLITRISCNLGKG